MLTVRSSGILSRVANGTVLVDACSKIQTRCGLESSTGNGISCRGYWDVGMHGVSSLPRCSPYGTLCLLCGFCESTRHVRHVMRGLRQYFTIYTWSMWMILPASVPLLRSSVYQLSTLQGQCNTIPGIWFLVFGLFLEWSCYRDAFSSSHSLCGEDTLSAFAICTDGDGVFGTSMIWCRLVLCTEQGRCWLMHVARYIRDVHRGIPCVIGCLVVRYWDIWICTEFHLRPDVHFMGLDVFYVGSVSLLAMRAMWWGARRQDI